MADREPTIHCNEFVEIATGYLEGTLPTEQRALVEAHLASCDGCRNYLDQMRKTIQTLGHLREEDVPVEVRDRLLSAFRELPPLSR